jgi:hypothetical protein
LIEELFTSLLKEILTQRRKGKTQRAQREGYFSSFPSSCLGTHSHEALLHTSNREVAAKGVGIALCLAEPGDQGVPKLELGNEGNAFPKLPSAYCPLPTPKVRFMPSSIERRGS